MDLIGSKWVYKIQLKSDGSIERFNEGLLPNVTFKFLELILIRLLLLSLTPTTLHVENAFLHGFLLKKNVFLEQSPGFVSEILLNHVCRLNRDLHRLKEATCAWFERISIFLLGLGFVSNEAGSSLFSYNLLLVFFLCLSMWMTLLLLDQILYK